MALESYYEKFYLQELKEVSAELYKLQDSTEIMGLFKQTQSGETAIASSQGVATHGRFATGSDIESGSTLRRDRDGIYIRIIGDPLQSPPQALTQVKTWESRIVSRSEAMQDEGGDK